MEPLPPVCPVQIASPALTQRLCAGFDFKQLIPGATGMSYAFPNPVTCDSLRPQGYLVVEVLDKGRIPRLSAPVYVDGDCSEAEKSPRAHLWLAREVHA